MAVNFGATPGPVVLDYGNGWYHPATGYETLRDVAAIYKKDAQLVAELNHAAADAIPARGTMVYIPPVCNRERLRPVLARIHEHPELIPRKPWNADTKLADADLKTKFMVKQADPWIAKRIKLPPIVESEHQVAASAPARSYLKPTVQAKARQHPNSSGGNAPWQARAGEPARAEEPQVQVASLTGEASLPSAALKKSDAMLHEIADKLTETRSHLTSTPPPAAAAETALASFGNSNAWAWPLNGQVITKYNAGWHQACHGIEIAAATGTPVRASRPGRVLMAQEFITYGKLIVIDHGDGYATAYGYNQDLKVRAGDRVAAGQVISTVGTAPHYGPEGKLFFQVRHNGLPVDPLQYLEKGR